MRGHIRKIKLKSGTAHEIVYYEHGIRKTKYFPPEIDRADIDIWLSEKLLEIQYEKAGVKRHRETSAMTLLDFWKYFEENRKYLIKKSTLTRYKLAWTNLCNVIDSSKPLADLNKYDLRKFRDERFKLDRLTNSGINRDLAHIRVILNLAVKDELIDTNPMIQVKSLRAPKKQIEILTDEEINRYYENLETEELKLAFRIIHYTGCRRRSIAVKDWDNVLQWKDINFEENNIKIIQKGDHTLIIPLHQTLKTILLETYLKKGRPSGNVISLHADTITHKFREAFDRAKITKDIQPVHGLRHRAATKLTECGVDLKTVSEILGHSDTKTTQIYIHPSMLYKQQAVTNL